MACRLGRGNCASYSGRAASDAGEILIRTDELDYELPPERIADHPCAPRDAARLMVINRANGQIEHRVFRDLPDYMRPGDCLVLNTTRVLAARFTARRASGGRIDGLFLREIEPGRWSVLLNGAGRLRIGERLRFDGGGDHFLTLLARGNRGECEAAIEPAEPAERVLEHVGHTPLPPYIARDHAGQVDDERRDHSDYQTVYAQEAGSVAAPTAGLHFTPELLARIQSVGVARADLTLHVGLATFVPVEVADLADHVMHAEWFDLPASTAATLNERRVAGGSPTGAGRIVAVGTTSARVLETCADDRGVLRAASDWTRAFITPPYRFRAVDALVTNFHLPRSTLLALVMAFGGIELIRRAYAIAIEQKYRFYSFGDAMLIA